MNVLRFDSEDAWTQAISSLWRDRLRMQPDLTMCLPSGTTPAAIYAEMSRSARERVVSFSRASVFVLDEFGGVGSDDPGRTAHTLRRQLIDGIDLPPSAFHVLDPDSPDLLAHCREYDAAIGRRFDLVLLGIGPNGHIGMNEPGSPLDSPTRRVDLHDSTIQSAARYFLHQNVPRWGVTVGLKRLLEAKEVWLLAKGPGKASIVRDTLQGNMELSNPASLLRRHPNASLFLDRAAGALLDK
ncbi:MAG: 6-phosphogluconolactonase [Vicinamibacterales bacterium]